MDGASRENLGRNKLYTHHPLPVLFLFICIIHTAFWLLGNKKKKSPYPPPSPPASQLTALLHRSQPLNRFVILADSHGRGTAPRIMDGPGGDYTPGECKAPTLQSDKSTTHPHLTLRPLPTSLPGIILLWDEIDLRHAGHVGENWFQRVLGTYLQMKAANQPGGWE